MRPSRYSYAATVCVQQLLLTDCSTEHYLPADPNVPVGLIERNWICPYGDLWVCFPGSALSPDRTLNPLFGDSTWAIDASDLACDGLLSPFSQEPLRESTSPQHGLHLRCQVSTLSLLLLSASSLSRKSTRQTALQLMLGNVLLPLLFC